MTQRQASPLLKLVLELGPVIAFFVGYFRWKDDVFTIAGRDYDGFIVVTAAFVPMIMATTAILWWLTGKLSRMQVLTVVLVVVFGALTVVFNDDAFFKMKPTIIYALFAGILGFGLLRGQSYMRALMGDLMPMAQEGWMILTRRMAVFFAVLAMSNEVVWRLMSTDSWVYFKTFALPLALFVFFMAQARLVERYGIRKDG